MTHCSRRRCFAWAHGSSPASLLCALGWRRRMTPEGAFVLGVCGSGALYVLSYLPLGVASEFRYVYWAVLASVAGLMVVLLPEK